MSDLIRRLLVAGPLFAALLPPGAPVRAELIPYGKLQAEFFNESTKGSRRDGASYAPMGNLYGIKGSYDLGDGLKSISQIQLRSRSARPCGHKGGNIFGGIAGGWGTLLIGPHDQPVNLSTAKTHLAAQTMMDSCDLLGAGGESTTGVYFISPSFAGLSLAQLIPLSNDIVTNDVAVIYSDGPFYVRDRKSVV